MGDQANSLRLLHSKKHLNNPYFNRHLKYQKAGKPDKIKLKEKVLPTKDEQTTITPEEPSNSSPQTEPSTTQDDSTPELPEFKGKIKVKLPKKMPVQLGEDQLPIPTKENLDRMTLEQLEEFCPSMTVERHLNPLLIKLGDFIQIPISSSSKREKCRALIKYKKEFPLGDPTQNRKTKLEYDQTYESFNWRDETTVKFRGRQYTLPHSPKFKAEINRMYQKYLLTGTDIRLNKVNPDDPRSPYKYQAIVETLYHPRTPYRGALVYHGLGSGKTRTSILVSTKFIEDNKKVLVLLPGALRNNYLQDLYRWGSQIHGIGIKNYDKLPGEEKIKAEKVSNRAIQLYYDILTYNEAGIYDKLKELTNPENGLLENRLIIIDEVHDLISRISKATNVSRRVYEFLMDRLVNCKLICLSGTPLLNNPYELGILFNIIRGKIRTPNQTYTLFPETEEEFNKFFVNLSDKSMVNGNLFQRRISGSVSYYAGTTDRRSMPEKIIQPPEILPMGNHQYRLYQMERLSEGRKEKQKSTGRNQSESSQQVGSAFRTYSRMVCNFAFPEGINRPKPVGANDLSRYNKVKNITLDEIMLENLDELQDEVNLPNKSDELISAEPPVQATNETSEDESFGQLEEKKLNKKTRSEVYAKELILALSALKQLGDAIFSREKLDQFSPKMNRIRINLQEGPGSDGLAYIYTEFRILEGVTLMGEVLQSDGYQPVNYSNITSFEDFKRLNPKGQLRYGVISSKVDSRQRKLLNEIFNHQENAHGEYIKVIMGTSASSQGINLKRVRQIHIMEPYWNMVRNDQVEGRGVRLGSHLDLPADEQNVHIFTYRMCLTADQQREMVELLENPKDSQSTDQYIHNLATQKDHINKQFLNQVKGASIDCNLNISINKQLNPNLICQQIPDDFPAPYLYYPNIEQDLLDQVIDLKTKQEDYKVSQIPGQPALAYKVNSSTGQPIFSHEQIEYKGKFYREFIKLYDYEQLSIGNDNIVRYYWVVSEKLFIPVN